MLLRKSWPLRFKTVSLNSLTKKTQVHQDHVDRELEMKILTKVRLGGDHFEMCLLSVVKSNFFSFNVKNIICRKILKNVVPLQRIYSQTILTYFLIITIFLITYSNMQIISLNMHDTKMSQAEMYSTRKNTKGSVEKSLVVMTIKLLQHLFLPLNPA